MLTGPAVAGVQRNIGSAASTSALPQTGPFPGPMFYYYDPTYETPTFKNNKIGRLLYSTAPVPISRPKSLLSLKTATV